MTDTQKTGTKKRTILISAGLAGAALVLAGGGVAIGAALADDGDDRELVAGEVRGPGAAATEESPAVSQPSAPAPVVTFGSASADELMAVIDAARAVASGEVISLDAERDGSWEVQLRTDTGDESEVWVDAAGTATLIETDRDDDRLPGVVLDRATLDALVGAALAEADGAIIDIDLDDDSVSPYDVTVFTGDGRTIDIDLSGDFVVLSAQLDD